MRLYDLALKGDHRSISVIGTAKNAGKTVTLNHLIEGAWERGITLGLTSAGRDGERLDLVSSTYKPPIHVHRGTVIATAQRLLGEERVSAEILDVTDMVTSMGPVVIARVMSSGYVQLAGPDTNREMKELINRLWATGCDMVLVDGALNRVSSASPSVTDSVVLSTGAVISRDMERVVEATAHRANLFSLDRVEDEEVLKRAEGIIYGRGVAVLSRGGDMQTLQLKTALQSGGHISRSISDDTEYIAFGGSLSGITLKNVAAGIGGKAGVTLIVRDATRIFIGPREWQYFLRTGIKVRVADRINLLAVTVNPHAPQGYYFEPGIFLRRMREALKPIMVFDVVQGGGLLDTDCIG